MQATFLMSLLSPVMTLAMTTREYHCFNESAPLLHGKPLCTWRNQLAMLCLQSIRLKPAQHKLGDGNISLKPSTCQFLAAHCAPTDAPLLCLCLKAPPLYLCVRP